MQTKISKGSQKLGNYTQTHITNPMKIEVGNSSIKQPIINTKQLLDKIAFTALGIGAVWAFYTALASLML